MIFVTCRVIDNLFREVPAADRDVGTRIGCAQTDDPGEPNEPKRSPDGYCEPFVRMGGPIHDQYGSLESTRAF